MRITHIRTSGAGSPFAGALLVLAVAACTGCNHDKPFEPKTGSVDTTRTRGTSRQLTYNLGADVRPAWRPDGSGVLFAFEDLGRDSSPHDPGSHRDTDLCLSLMLPTGGMIAKKVCGISVGSLDSIDTFFEAAENSEGRLLYDRESSVGSSLTPSSAALVLSSLIDPNQYTTIRPYPYPAPDGTIHQGIGYVRWLSATTAIYLGQQVLYPRPCNGCPADTVRMGLDLVKLDLSGTTPSISIIPNTHDASSVAVNPQGGGIFFTKNGDSRVFQIDPATSNVTIVHDFGALGIARDVQVSGTRMIAVVGGRVSYGDIPGLGTIQKDASGVLWEVDLTNGNAIDLTVTDRWFRRPALSPAGDRLVAEGYFARISSCSPPFGCLDTTVGRDPDLWLFDLP
ncbi:MAG: hypothetical protein ABI679_15270 [Gemmatimonadota bacterium]